MERRTVKTAAGMVDLAFTTGGLYSLALPANGANLFPPVASDDPLWLPCLASRLQQYFNGEAVSFSCPVDFSGYPPFFKRVLAAAAGIPYGATLTYRGLAELAGCPRGARAVGQAMAANRTPLVIPCHRVVQSNGKAGGFSGGPGWKEKLLELEKRAKKGHCQYAN